MSLDTQTGDALVDDESSLLAYVSSAVTAVALGLAVAGIATIFGVFDLTTTVSGLSAFDYFGIGFVGLGVVLVGIGVASRIGVIDTKPDRTAGALPAAVFGLIGFVVGSLIGSSTLGFSTFWPVFGIIGGVSLAAATLLPREDLGVTIPAGGLALFGGLTFLSGLITPSWTWEPIAGSATYTGTFVIPFLALFLGLLTAWVGAEAYGGFGTRGRQMGAYLLIGANAVGMLSLLVILVAFVVSKGFAPMTRGIRFGLFWEPLTWFYFPPIDKYVVIEGPLVWFYWPFVMEGVALMTEINGIFPAIVGTVWVVFGAVVFAIPLGVGAAVFLTEYAERGWFTKLVEISTDGLWSTPSIVYGLFGLAFLVPRLGNTTSLLSGMLVLGFMMLPLVVITSREALKSVPDDYRDASAALGVGKWETIKSVVLPAAMPGVITGAILGIGRIAGETAPILLVMVSDPFPSRATDVFAPEFAFVSDFPFVHAQVIDPNALLQPTSALPYQLYAIITAGVGQRESFAWGTALVLLLVVLSFYVIGIGSRMYFRRKLEQ
ncbi:phosphate ABC transporter permease PstA [Halogeometricum borinquense]|uniref:Phosphate transport system permease protein PstA n=1 Tax=Halogeometricum borinquense TaxID=60847 RepID=A0A6C0UQR7_9EURY|nr:phosphate ABC transporter permease PstA [Halogeometricum borinquense]QIB75288.1 phosphate ABC transporter permease PstA [Halogeometricum borinquense]QIQ75767.1 phosphate ABC transporter permease PstA [Halogeometricum borinquense]